ncbi:hypothetical protein CEUSTIGMA_g13558.t1 [Chlamydomonas eustigma]|uniref:NADP-dependent oxidoreductase domain-containing protein n=1 Tax=Chlamydomonas eustigma TaxID=1157962 RepID=A0A250XSW4_9CHLO|nr:hypothetical protein CEUSTIGMA_g13558.t1 [Chlamydomonas eustigma]|eukprot:GAX86145.1 hypothetical protein CEUSTIGMA_g13558.t1 [Chlamydomonas eustigma]
MTYPKTVKCQASGVPIIRRRALLNLAPGLCSATLCLPFSPPGHASSSDALSKNRKYLPVQHAGVRMPRAKLPGGLEVSKIIKGCWQLDGAHRGDRSSDRTSGAEAVADFERFFGSGVTTIDTAGVYIMCNTKTKSAIKFQLHDNFCFIQYYSLRLKA